MSSTKATISICCVRTILVATDKPELLPDGFLYGVQKAFGCKLWYSCARICHSLHKVPISNWFFLVQGAREQTLTIPYGSVSEAVTMPFFPPLPLPGPKLQVARLRAVQWGWGCLSDASKDA